MRLYIEEWRISIKAVKMIMKPNTEKLSVKTLK